MVNFYPNFMKIVNSQTQKTQQTPNPRHTKKMNL